MATSRSSSDSGWIAGAFVFSGRPDPTWPIAPEAARELRATWDTLLPWEGPLPSPPPLGYRGCFVRDPGGRTWAAFHEAVTLSANGASETRRDEDRRFERIVLASAPEGTLPPSLVS
jgi:hypothetical protein